MLRSKSLKPGKGKILSRVTKISVFIWLACVLGVFAVIAYVVGVRKELFDKAPDVFTFSLFCLILLGCLAFLVGALSFVTQFIAKRAQGKQNFFIFLIKLFLILAILPLYLLIDILEPIEIVRRLKHDEPKGLLKSLRLKSILSRAVALVLVGVIFFPIWVGGYIAVGAISYNMFNNAVGNNPESISISGTGSMFPTFPKGNGKTPQELAKEIVGSPGMLHYPNGLMIFGKRYFDHKLERGDIIRFENSATEKITKEMYGRSSGYIKRLIALPGDTIELRNGIVYLNGDPLAELYTAKPHSTFAESFLPECKKITVPADKAFAMGDNRKGSGDSREIGFVDFKDISHVISLSSQKGVWDKNYRDTINDINESSKIKLDKDKYLELLNKEREKAGVKPLKYQPKFEQSAFKRGEVILKFNDFSYNATRSGYLMKTAMYDVGYSNIVWNEAMLQGYYDANEMIEYYFEFPKWKEFLLEKDYQEIGIAEVQGQINGCPTQVIVQHFAGYVPPNYTKETIDSWGRVINNMDEIIPSWEKVRGSQYFNQDDLNKLLGLMYKRKSNAESIYYAMKANQWLTNNQELMIKEDEDLYKQGEVLVKKLNGK